MFCDYVANAFAASAVARGDDVCLCQEIPIISLQIVAIEKVTVAVLGLEIIEKKSSKRTDCDWRNCANGNPPVTTVIFDCPKCIFVFAAI